MAKSLVIDYQMEVFATISLKLHGKMIHNELHNFEYIS